MRVRDAAKQLEVSVSTIYALVASGRLRCSRVGLGRGVIRISDEQLADYRKGSEPVPPSVPAPARTVRLKHLKIS